MTTIGSAGTGTRGTLIIDDDGTNIRFYLSQGDPATFIGSPGANWSGVVNGVSVGGKWTWGSGGGTRLIAGPWAVGSSQTVSFSIGSTGTQGFGGGNTAYASVFRPTPPGAPVSVGVDQATPTSLRYRFSGTTTGGSAITGWQAQIATNAAFTTGVQTVSSSGTTTFNNLTPATKYYFRSRGSNAVGWSGWSNTASGTTESGAYASVNGKWVPVPVNWSNGSAWTALAPLASNGTAWVRPI